MKINQEKKTNYSKIKLVLHLVVSFGLTKIPKLAVSLDRETNETNLFVPDRVRSL
jgi:hypothetical protein